MRSSLRTIQQKSLTTANSRICIKSIIKSVSLIALLSLFSMWRSREIEEVHRSLRWNVNVKKLKFVYQLYFRSSTDNKFCFHCFHLLLNSNFVTCIEYAGIAHIALNSFLILKEFDSLYDGVRNHHHQRTTTSKFDWQIIIFDRYLYSRFSSKKKGVKHCWGRLQTEG